MVFHKEVSTLCNLSAFSGVQIKSKVHFPTALLVQLREMSMIYFLVLKQVELLAILHVTDYFNMQVS
jgi:hypothetical protein